MKRFLKWLGTCGFTALIALVLGTLAAFWASGAEAPVERAPAFPFFADAPPFMNVAHRGASVDAPEHSREAFALALAQGAHMLELDLRMTRDQILVVHHDADLRRIAGVPVRIADATLIELKNVADHLAPLPLRDVFAMFPTARFNLELKDRDPAQAAILWSLLQELDLENRVVVASFHKEPLDAFRSLAGTRVLTAASTSEAARLYACFKTGLVCRIRYGVLEIPHSSPFALTDPAFIAYAHRLGLKVFYWTVDDEATMRVLQRAGADGIMTKRPAVLAQILRSN
jgi:glycerophosphoryl diester phosphodiesterase